MLLLLFVLLLLLLKLQGKEGGVDWGKKCCCGKSSWDWMIDSVGEVVEKDVDVLKKLERYKRRSSVERKGC